MVPEELRYTTEHEWVVRSGADTVRLGITDYAQRQLGDVVHVELPRPGVWVQPGTSVGEVASTRSTSEVYAPVGGEVVVHNTGLWDSPELLNADPYGAGWMIEIRPTDPTLLDSLLTAAAYRSYLDDL